MSLFCTFDLSRIAFLAAKRNVTIGLLAACVAAAPGFAGTSTASKPAVSTKSASTSTAINDSPWWQHVLVYEIYPRSCQDTNSADQGMAKMSI